MDELAGYETMRMGGERGSLEIDGIALDLAAGRASGSMPRWTSGFNVIQAGRNPTLMSPSEERSLQNSEQLNCHFERRC
jgi:hypothetical protein